MAVGKSGYEILPYQRISQRCPCCIMACHLRMLYPPVTYSSFRWWKSPISFPYSKVPQHWKMSSLSHIRQLKNCNIKKKTLLWNMKYYLCKIMLFSEKGRVLVCLACQDKHSHLGIWIISLNSHLWLWQNWPWILLILTKSKF